MMNTIIRYMIQEIKTFIKYLQWLEEKRMEYMIKSGRGF